MKYWYGRIATLIRDHTIAFSVLAVLISCIAGAYALGFQLGQNRQQFLSDKIETMTEKASELAAENETTKRDNDQINSDLQEREAELSSARSAFVTATNELNDARVKNARDFTAHAMEIEGIASDFSKYRENSEKEASDKFQEIESLKHQIAVLTDKNDQFQSVLDGQIAAHEEFIAMAAGDITSFVDKESNWYKFYDIKSGTDYFEFNPYKKNIIIEDGNFMELRNGKYAQVKFNQPFTRVNGKRFCYGNYVPLNEKSYHLRSVCRLNIAGKPTDQ